MKHFRYTSSLSKWICSFLETWSAPVPPPKNSSQMDIRNFFNIMPAKTPYASGLEYETSVQARLRSLSYLGDPVVVSDVAGSNKSAHDIVIQSPVYVPLEAKRANASEGGGCTMRLRDGKIQLPENSVLQSFLPADFKLWDGRIPSCLTGDKSVETWNAEKPLFHGIYLPVSSSAVADYYRAKGTFYLQVEGHGLYHTGEDVYGWGVPKFVCDCKIRIRLKQHHSSSVPQDVQACFNYKVNTLPPSLYDFMSEDRLPPGFLVPVE